MVKHDHLLSTLEKPILLHGDLHHYNIVSHEDSWVAIDPMGIIGDQAFETAVFIRNPIPLLLNHPESHSIITHRIELFSQILEIKASRIVQWCFVQAVLAWVWAIEDNGEETYFKRLTEYFDELT